MWCFKFVVLVYQLSFVYCSPIKHVFHESYQSDVGHILQKRDGLTGDGVAHVSGGSKAYPGNLQENISNDVKMGNIKSNILSSVTPVGSNPEIKHLYPFMKPKSSLPAKSSILFSKIRYKPGTNSSSGYTEASSLLSSKVSSSREEKTSVEVEPNASQPSEKFNLIPDEPKAPLQPIVSAIPFLHPTEKGSLNSEKHSEITETSSTPSETVRFKPEKPVTMVSSSSYLSENISSTHEKLSTLGEASSYVPSEKPISKVVIPIASSEPEKSGSPVEPSPSLPSVKPSFNHEKPSLVIVSENPSSESEKPDSLIEPSPNNPSENRSSEAEKPVSQMEPSPNNPSKNRSSETEKPVSLVQPSSEKHKSLTEPISFRLSEKPISEPEAPDSRMEPSPSIPSNKATFEPEKPIRPMEPKSEPEKPIRPMEPKSEPEKSGRPMEPIPSEKPNSKPENVRSSKYGKPVEITNLSFKKPSFPSDSKSEKSVSLEHGLSIPSKPGPKPGYIAPVAPSLTLSYPTNSNPFVKPIIFLPAKQSILFSKNNNKPDTKSASVFTQGSSLLSSKVSSSRQEKTGFELEPNAFLSSVKSNSKLEPRASLESSSSFPFVKPNPKYDNLSDPGNHYFLLPTRKLSSTPEKISTSGEASFALPSEKPVFKVESHFAPMEAKHSHSFKMSRSNPNKQSPLMETSSLSFEEASTDHKKSSSDVFQSYFSPGVPSYHLSSEIPGSKPENSSVSIKTSPSHSFEKPHIYPEKPSVPMVPIHFMLSERPGQPFAPVVQSSKPKNPSSSVKNPPLFEKSGLKPEKPSAPAVQNPSLLSEKPSSKAEKPSAPVVQSSKPQNANDSVRRPPFFEKPGLEPEKPSASAAQNPPLLFEKPGSDSEKPSAPTVQNSPPLENPGSKAEKHSASAVQNPPLLSEKPSSNSEDPSAPFLQNPALLFQKSVLKAEKPNIPAVQSPPLLSEKPGSYSEEPSAPAVQNPLPFEKLGSDPDETSARLTKIPPLLFEKPGSRAEKPTTPPVQSPTLLSEYPISTAKKPSVPVVQSSKRQKPNSTSALQFNALLSGKSHYLSSENFIYSKNGNSQLSKISGSVFSSKSQLKSKFSSSYPPEVPGSPIADGSLRFEESAFISKIDGTLVLQNSPCG